MGKPFIAEIAMPDYCPEGAYSSIIIIYGITSLSMAGQWVCVLNFNGWINPVVLCL